jgi:CheY-like chemotaxis protein
VARKRIAVIDDDPTIRELLDAALRDEGYEITLLPAAQEAATYLRTNVPDLIFLDIHMEQRDVGWSLLSLLWLEPTLSTVPVIISSADRADLDQHRQVVQAQHSVLMAKPFDLDELVTTVERLIGSAT